jgi:hypothetical protein
LCGVVIDPHSDHFNKIAARESASFASKHALCEVSLPSRSQYRRGGCDGGDFPDNIDIR